MINSKVRITKGSFIGEHGTVIERQSPGFYRIQLREWTGTFEVGEFVVIAETGDKTRLEVLLQGLLRESRISDSEFAAIWCAVNAIEEEQMIALGGLFGLDGLNTLLRKSNTMRA